MRLYSTIEAFQVLRIARAGEDARQVRRQGRAVSSKRALRRKACSGKRRYGTEEEARAGIAGLRRKEPATGWLTTYKCRFCGGFHFGHPTRRVRQAIAARGRA